MNFIKSIQNCVKYSDKILWSIILVIALYSMLLVASVSREGFNYLTIQFISVMLGMVGALLLQTINYKVISKYYIWIGVFCILFIIYTLFMGVTVEGSSGVNARAWIKLPGGITFQPSELVKIGFIITFAKHLSIVKNTDNFKDIKNICLLGAHALIPVVLTHMQGDDGAAIIFLCIAITMSFMAGLPLRYFGALIVLGAIFIPIAWNFVLADYQKKRIITQMNPEGDPLNMGYQQIQGKLSIGS